MFDFLIEKIDSYYEKRQLVVPNTKDSLLWLTSELGELVDAVQRNDEANNWVRNNPGKKADLEGEVADVLLMLMVTAKTLSIDPFESLLDKMHRKLKEQNLA